ncbi:hypothetical protein ACFQVA_19645 [Actinomadura keratinilytica]
MDGDAVRGGRGRLERLGLAAAVPSAVVSAVAAAGTRASAGAGTGAVCPPSLSVWARAPWVRSGTSLMKIAAIRARAAIGAPIRKTSATPWP